MARTAQSLRARAMAALARREYSRQELRLKLLRPAGAGWRLPRSDADASNTDPCEPALETEVEAVLTELEAHGLLSDARFVESRVHARQGRFGNRRILHELQQHGVEVDSTIQAELQASEYSRALEVWNRRFGIPAPNAQEQARQTRFLAARGFSADTIRRVLRRSEG